MSGRPWDPRKGNRPPVYNVSDLSMACEEHPPDVTPNCYPPPSRPQPKDWVSFPALFAGKDTQ